jgi:hypothetical protein
MIKRRITEQRRVVSHFDEALAHVPMDQLKAYSKSLDIEDLGDLRGLKERPTVFTVRPLTVKYEHLAFDIQTGIDFWGIFSTHVTAVTDLPFELTFIDDVINEKHRSEFPPRIVQDIASIVVTLSNNNGESIPFTPPGGFWRFVGEAKSRRASEAGAVASAAVESSASQLANALTVATPTNTDCP